jgi:HemY protein
MRAEPTERMCMLMAEIEEGEHGDQGRVRAWLRRAVQAPPDPVWTADGHVFEQWAPVSPVSGRVDAFEWRVVAEQVPRTRAVEIDAETEAFPKEIAPAGAARQPSGAAEKMPAPLPAGPPPPPSEIKAITSKVEPVQPSPDDPGPPPADGDRRRFGAL